MDKRLYPTGNDPRAGGTHTEVLGVSDGLRLATGEVTLDGGNPTDVVTGLATVTGATACIKSPTALGDDPVAVSVDYGGSVAAGTLEVHAWKHDGTDPTLVASTDSAEVITWIAVGT